VVESSTTLMVMVFKTLAKMVLEMYKFSLRIAKIKFVFSQPMIMGTIVSKYPQAQQQLP